MKKNQDAQRNGNSLFGIFAAAAEFRRKSGNFRHELHEVLAITFLAMSLGNCCTSVRKIAGWARENEMKLRGFGMELRCGTPSHQTICRIFAAMPTRVMRTLAARWRARAVEIAHGETIAIDGKALAGASRGESRVPYIVSAWACESKVALSQMKTEEKTNEISAIPKLIEAIGEELEGKVVTIDAAGCQKKIAAAIRSKGADYVLALKKNHPTMHAEMLKFFRECRTTCAKSFKEHRTVEKNRGRYEERLCVQTDDLDWFAEKAQWKDLRSAIMVEEKRMDAKGETNDVRLYVSSLPSDPERAQRCVRAHWGIENSLHWTLDVVFREDECRVRTGNGAENFSLMRHLIAGVLKVEGDKTGASVGESVFSGVCAQERVFARVFGEIERRECV